MRASPIYETEAHTLEPGERQPAYLNAVLEVRTLLTPEELLSVCLDVEREFGRTRTGRWEPRTIDLDLLAFGDSAILSEALQLPHPRLGSRQFVLRPFADLAGDLLLPAPYDATVYSLLERTQDRGEVRRYPGLLALPG